MKNNEVKVTTKKLSSLNDILSVNLMDFDFSINNDLISENKYYYKLINKYQSLNNCIIIYNGKIIFNNTIDKLININQNFQKDSLLYRYDELDFIEKINSDSLNSFLEIKVLKNSNENLNINLVIANDIELAHYTNIISGANTHTIINEYFESFENKKINHFTNGFLNKHSTLLLKSLQVINNKNDNSFKYYFKVDEGAELDLSLLNLNDSDTLNQALVDIIGEHATGSVNTATIANNNTNLSGLVKITHLNKNTNSMINNLGIVNDNAKFSINGVGFIEQGFAKSVAMQESKIIKLSDTAQSIANPQLIINEFDVKAGHAATVGGLDEDQLYYLMSRGLRRNEASELLLMASLNEFIEKYSDSIEIDKINETIKNKIS